MNTPIAPARMKQLCEECTNTIQGFLHDDSDHKKIYDKAIAEIEDKHGPSPSAKKLDAYFKAMESALRAENHPVPETLKVQVSEAMGSD